MTRIHLGFPSHAVADVHMRDWGTVARMVESAGFDGLWHSNERFFREMFVRMTVSATVTKRILLGGAVAEGFAVHPALTAQSLASVAELAEGRTALAIGAGGSGLPMMGIERRAVVRTVRETYRAIQALLAGETIDATTPSFVMRGARLHARPAQRVPLWVASRGARTLRTAGVIADGVMIASQALAPGIRQALDWVAEGAADTGRDVGQIARMARVDTCVHPDPALARDGCRLMVAKLLWMSYPDRAFVRAAGLTVPPALEEIIATRDYDALESVAQHVPDDMIEAFCWAGSPARVAEQITAAAQAGVSDVGLWLLRAPGQRLDEAITLLADEVVPRLRADLGGTP